MKRETSPCKMSAGLYEQLKSEADKRGIKMIWLLDHMAIVQLEKWMKEKNEK
jgi:hypothetical protein